MIEFLPFDPQKVFLGGVHEQIVPLTCYGDDTRLVAPKKNSCFKF